MTTQRDTNFFFFFLEKDGHQLNNIYNNHKLYNKFDKYQFITMFTNDLVHIKISKATRVSRVYQKENFHFQGRE